MQKHRLEKENGSCILQAQGLRPSLSSRVWLVEEGNFTSNLLPVKFTFHWLATLCHLMFLPLQELVAAGGC